MAEKSAAVLTIRDGSDMTPEGRKAIEDMAARIERIQQLLDRLRPEAAPVLTPR